MISLREVDVTGLSYSLTKPSGKYTVTTIEAVNNTGVLRATIDGLNHVSVVGIYNHEEWIKSKNNANTNPHPNSVLLKSISIVGKR